MHICNCHVLGTMCQTRNIWNWQGRLFSVHTQLAHDAGNKNSFSPSAPGNFPEKHVLKLVKQFSGHCHAERAKLYHKPIYRSYTSWPSDPGTKYYLGEFGHGQKAKFLPPLFSLLLPHFFSFTEYLVGFILVRKKIRKAFRILGLDERRDRWVVEQDFHGYFQINVTQFFAFRSGTLHWIVVTLVWFKRSLYSAQVNRQSCPWH